jgi:hypothetical protein
MAIPPNDPSIFSEPHLRPAPPRNPAGPILPYAGPHTPRGELDPNQDVVYEPVTAAREARVEHSVWDEPGLSSELAGAPGEDQLTYARWLASRKPRWTWSRSWGLTLLLALAAGPWAVFGALWTRGDSIFGAFLLVFFGPVTEELLKIGAILLVVEKAPFAFRAGSQIVLCALAGGLAFAAIENLMYLFVYVPNPSVALVLWRWTVCVALHAGCSLIAGLGVLRVWRDVWARQGAPQLSLAYSYLVTAAVVHGVYNALALIGEKTGLLEF